MFSQPNYMPEFSISSRPTLLVLLVLCASCNALPEHDEEATSWPEVLQFASIGWGHNAPLDSTVITTRVITTSVDWAVYQDSLQPLLPFRPVDFSTQMVILVASPVPTDGYGLRIQMVESFNDTTTVTYRLFEPAPDCRVADMPGNAFDVVRLNRNDQPVAFVEETESLKCTPP